MELTDRQKWVLQQIVAGVRADRPRTTLGGFAGTGKTVLVNYLVKFFPRFAVVAFTGKAANVLRKRGVHAASTIHSRIYKPFFDNGVVYFDLTPDPGCDGFIVDEASMVSKDLYDDLMSFGLPAVFVGDHGQLEPVESKFNLMAQPDYTLEEIHRNAGDIARFAEHLRNGLAARGFCGQDGSVELVRERRLSDDRLLEADQIICAYNATRVEVNGRVRAAQGRTELLHAGERVMCLRNSRRGGLFNGMQGEVVALRSDRRGRHYMDFRFDRTLFPDVRYDRGCFGKESYKIKTDPDSPHPFDYAACVTAHKFQGDEADHVLVVEQKCKNWCHRRWAYTAASRAKKKLVWQVAP